MELCAGPGNLVIEELNPTSNTPRQFGEGSAGGEWVAAWHCDHSLTGSCKALCGSY